MASLSKTCGNSEFLIKYCKIMVSKLDNIADQERMSQWLEEVMNSECDEKISRMYLELILWALHTDRINVFPFKYFPPVQHADINDAYQYALEIVQFEPEECIENKCGEVKTVVTDDLKEYFAVQAVPGFGKQCFYAFSDKSPICNWNIPLDVNVPFNKELVHEPQYWMTLFSRPESSLKDASKHVEDDERPVGKEEELVEDDGHGESERSLCPDLSKVEYILNNLAFGGRKPQDVRSLVVRGDEQCTQKKEGIAKSSCGSSRRNTEIEIGSFVVSVDYSNNKLTEPSTSKKNMGKSKSGSPKTHEAPRSNPKQKCSIYSPKACSLDSIEDLYTGLANRRRLLNENDSTKENCPDDSTTALYSVSSFVNNACLRKKADEHESNFRSSVPRFLITHPSKENQARSGHADVSKFPGENSSSQTTLSVDSKESRRRPRERFSFEEVKTSPGPRSRARRFNNVGTTSRPLSAEGYEDLRRPVKDKGGHPRSNYLRCVHPSAPAAGRNVSNRTRCNADDFDTTKETLSSSNKSERKLQFSDIVVEPQHHRPRTSADGPLKPCLRKRSDETASPKPSDHCNGSHKSQDYVCRQNHCYYAKPSSNKAPRPNRQLNKKP